MWNIWRSELRMTVRQRSYYSFLILWVAVLSLLFLLQGSCPLLNRVYEYDWDGSEYCVIYHSAIYVNHWFLFNCE